MMKMMENVFPVNFIGFYLHYTYCGGFSKKGK